ncbi:MAG: hypothetical protein LQ346_006021 [Caloplaca aetnensis]|nr:MAG: hypothetical protein LQ346_006021 [Caloplaca aetnensis]
MPPIGVDEWMDNFVAEWAPDHDPSNLPSASEQKAVSEYLHGKISVEEAAFAYTRDTISGQTSGDVWFLIYHIAQDLPEAQGRLIELIRAISTLPDESCASGKDQSWSTVSLGDLHGDLCDYWDGLSDYIRVHPATTRRRAFVDLTRFIARLGSEGLLRTAYFSDAVMFLALEREESLQVLDTWLLAATRYLEWAVQDVFAESQKGSAIPGPLLKKAREHGDISRWQFWKSRMAVLGDEDCLSQETRNAARSSLARMLEAESAAPRNKDFIMSLGLASRTFNSGCARTPIRRTEDVQSPLEHESQSNNTPTSDDGREELGADPPRVNCPMDVSAGTAVAVSKDEYRLAFVGGSCGV